MIALGFVTCACIGALARAVLTDLDAPFDRQMWGTLGVNVAGSFLLGLVHDSGAEVITTIGIGGLGAFTTFSTFISQVECIQREARQREAVLYVAATLVLGVGAGWVGWSLG